MGKLLLIVECRMSISYNTISSSLAWTRREKMHAIALMRGVLYTLYILYILVLYNNVVTCGIACKIRREPLLATYSSLEQAAHTRPSPCSPL